MGRIWAGLMLISTIAAMVRGKAGEAAQALLAVGGQAITLWTTLLAAMTLWSGLMEILSATGDVARLGRLFRRMLGPLFPGIEDDEAWHTISMNLSANLLGLGNAATPAGIEAAKRLAELGKQGLSALVMLLVLDNASVQLLPTTVITMRQAVGSGNPADIWWMTLMVSGSTMAAAVMMMCLLRRGGLESDGIKRHGDHGHRGLHFPSRLDDGN